MRLDVVAAGRSNPLPEPAPSRTVDAKGKSPSAPKPPKGIPPPSAALDLTLNSPADSTPVQEAIQKAICSSKEAVRAAVNTFYVSRDPKLPLTRPTQLPEKQADLVDKIVHELDGHNVRVQEHVMAASRRLRAQVRMCDYSQCECVG